MKTYQKIFCICLVALFIVFLSVNLFAQTINAAYVNALYKKYPTVKSNFCPACKLWVNPYYKSIADTQRHIPIVTYELFTKSNYALTSKINIPRSGVYAGWHPVYGQPNEDNVYTAANKAGKGEISKGHNQCWVLNAFSYDSAILSDTYTFNAACEAQGQNVGTEIATENMTRKLLLTNDVEVWCGTFDTHKVTFTDGKITDTYPDHYWKIIKYGQNVDCFWMPNSQEQSQKMLASCIVPLQQLINNLGFDPRTVLNQQK